MTRVRSYRQFCPAARALDLVGERWTLLIVRELLSGPKRYTDLQDGLSGIGPNVLAGRLRSLEDAALIEKRRLPPPAASTVYVLTELGSGLRPVLLGLVHWGLQFLDAPGPDEVVRASYWLLAVQEAADAGAVPDATDETYELHVGDEIISVIARDGHVEVTQGPARSPDVVVRTDHQAFAELGRGRLEPTQAIAAGRLSVDGDIAAAERCASLFGLATASEERHPA
jgi:DNA-binding HxlR family transcriptional regulator/putative sterol carrier protein